MYMKGSEDERGTHNKGRKNDNETHRNHSGLGYRHDRCIECYRTILFDPSDTSSRSKLIERATRLARENGHAR